MTSMENPLYRNYTMFCLGSSGGKGIMQTAVTPYSSDDKIRSYMFGEHNANARQEIHKAVGYSRDDPKIKDRFSPEILETLRRRGIELPDKFDEIVVLHAGLPVDTMSAEEFAKYNESSSVRQPVAC